MVTALASIGGGSSAAMVSKLLLLGETTILGAA